MQTATLIQRLRESDYSQRVRTRVLTAWGRLESQLPVGDDIGGVGLAAISDGGLQRMVEAVQPDGRGRTVTEWRYHLKIALRLLHPAAQAQ